MLTVEFFCIENCFETLNKNDLRLKEGEKKMVCRIKLLYSVSS